MNLSNADYDILVVGGAAVVVMIMVVEEVLELFSIRNLKQQLFKLIPLLLELVVEV